MFEFLVNKLVVIKDLVRIGRNKKAQGARKTFSTHVTFLLSLILFGIVGWCWPLKVSSNSWPAICAQNLPPEVRHTRFSPRSDSGPSSFPSTSHSTVSLPCGSSPVDHDSSYQGFNIIMSSIIQNCVTYNCRGWNSGLCVLPDLLEHVTCFIQQYWLFTEQLSDLNFVNNEFISVGVCGIDSGI